MNSKYPKRQRPVYGNIEVLHPEGFLMFCANDKKADWYLSRGLATVISYNPPVIQLTFVPKGVGRKTEKRGLVYKKNICVACGHSVVQEMNRHHIVPYCYRKSFPPSIKDFNDYDVVCICFDCHEKYEIFAQQLKRRLGLQYCAPFDGAIGEDWTEADKITLRAQKSATALINHRAHIPLARIQELEDLVKAHLKKETVTEEDLHSLVSIPLVCLTPKSSKEQLHGHKVAIKVLEEPDGIKNFFHLWRKHFMETMNPTHMPDGWHENLPIRYPEPKSA